MIEFRRIIYQGRVTTVQVEDEHFIDLTGKRISVDDVVHLPPVEARKVVCVHLNYRSRLEELGRKQAPAPTYFWKSPTSLLGHKGQVICPANCQFLNYEGEIALIVGRVTRNIRPEEAADYILGYAVGNDLGLHDFRDTDDNSMVRVKGSDTMGPIGPGIVTDFDFRGKMLRTRVDGKIVQETSTDDLLWDPHYLLADLARTITLEPGDVIYTGTPANSRPVFPGSTVTVEVEGLGLLENKITRSDLRIPDDFGAQPSESDGVQRVALGSDFKSKV